MGYSPWAHKESDTTETTGGLNTAVVKLKVRLPRWLSGKESACQSRKCRRRGFDPWVRKIPWSRTWQPTPVFLPGESHRQWSLAGYSPWGPKAWDTAEQPGTHAGAGQWREQEASPRESKHSKEERHTCKYALRQEETWPIEKPKRVRPRPTEERGNAGEAGRGQKAQLFRDHVKCGAFTDAENRLVLPRGRGGERRSGSVV